jgi:hypothetical protein
MLQGLLQRGDLDEPGTILRLGGAGFGVAGHLFDARQLCGIDAQETAPAACVLVRARRAVGAVTVAQSDLAQQEVLLELVPLFAPDAMRISPNGRKERWRSMKNRGAAITSSGNTAV